MRSKWFFVLLLASVVFIVGAYFYLRHPVPWYPKQHGRLDVLAKVGSAFAIVAALFSSLGLVALIWTIWVQIDQLKIINDGQRQEARQALYLSLSQRVGEIIGDSEIESTAKSMLSHGVGFHGLEIVFVPGQKLLEEARALIADLSAKLQGKGVPVHQRFRRQRLFLAIEKLLDSCSAFQRELYKDALNAQIHDDAARMLIVKSLAESDERTIRIFGAIGMDFSVLNEVPEVADQLTRAFSEFPKA